MSPRDLGLTDVGAVGPAAAGPGCACCATTDAVDRPAAPGVDASDAVTTYGVAGMTCGHCVGAVTAELSALPGVRGVDVRLVAGGTSAVTVTSTAPLDDGAVRVAVDEAGYDLTGRLS